MRLLDTDGFFLSMSSAFELHQSSTFLELTSHLETYLYTNLKECYFNNSQIDWMVRENRWEMCRCV